MKRAERAKKTGGWKDRNGGNRETYENSLSLGWERVGVRVKTVMGRGFVVWVPRYGLGYGL